MDKRRFLIGVISEFLRGGLSGSAAARIVADALGGELPREGERQLFRRCEEALWSLGRRGTRAREAELRYYLDCLRGKRRFDPQHPACTTQGAPLLIRIRLRQGVYARFVAGQGYHSVFLMTDEPRLLCSPRALETTQRFTELITWHKARATRVGGAPYYLVPRARFQRFLRELKAWLELEFAGA